MVFYRYPKWFRLSAEVVVESLLCERIPEAVQRRETRFSTDLRPCWDFEETGSARFIFKSSLFVFLNFISVVAKERPLPDVPITFAYLFSVSFRARWRTRTPRSLWTWGSTGRKFRFRSRIRGRSRRSFLWTGASEVSSFFFWRFWLWVNSDANPFSRSAALADGSYFTATEQGRTEREIRSETTNICYLDICLEFRCATDASPRTWRYSAVGRPSVLWEKHAYTLQYTKICECLNIFCGLGGFVRNSLEQQEHEEIVLQRRRSPLITGNYLVQFPK